MYSTWLMQCLTFSKSECTRLEHLERGRERERGREGERERERERGGGEREGERIKFIAEVCLVYIFLH